MKKFFVVFALIFVSSMLSADNSDEMACKFARKVGTVDVWKNYLETYPGGSCAFEAESFMKMNKQATPRDMEANNPQDVNACAMARQKNRPDVWRIYLESYPHGICAFEAKMAITELEEKAKAEQAERVAAAAAAENAAKRTNCQSDDRTFPCKDNSTGYMWSRGAGSAPNWRAARNYCSHLEEGGYSDWRLPSYDELLTLCGTNFGDSMVKLGGKYEFFWTSSVVNDPRSLPGTIKTVFFGDVKSNCYRQSGPEGGDISGVICVR